MRVIKFRVWNNNKKSWIHGTHERPELDGVNLFGETILLGGFMRGTSIKDLNDCEALQFTGLKDKNGKEIFEGDVLQVLGYPKKYVTRWCLSSWEFFYTDKHGTWTVPWGDMCSEAEIIGNIFENPELIK